MINDNKDLKNKLLAGQFVHIYLHGANFQNAYAVPQVAIFRDDTGPFVYVLDSANKVERRYVTTGKMVGELWIVNNGLKNGDKVIVNGGLKINVGEKVIVDHTVDGAGTKVNAPAATKAV